MEQRPVETKQEVEVTPEQQREQAVSVAKVHQRALDNLVRLDIRNYLNMLTAPGVSGADKMAIKISIERAITAAADYGVDVVNQGLLEKGKMAKLENSFAAHLARLMDNRMLLLADKMEKEQNNTETKQGETVNE